MSVVVHPLLSGCFLSHRHGGVRPLRSARHRRLLLDNVLPRKCVAIASTPQSFLREGGHRSAAGITKRLFSIGYAARYSSAASKPPRYQTNPPKVRETAIQSPESHSASLKDTSLAFRWSTNRS